MPQAGKIDLVAVMGGHHRHAGEPAFRRLRLEQRLHPLRPGPFHAHLAKAVFTGLNRTSQRLRRSSTRLAERVIPGRMSAAALASLGAAWSIATRIRKTGSSIPSAGSRALGSIGTRDTAVTRPRPAPYF